MDHEPHIGVLNSEPASTPMPNEYSADELKHIRNALRNHLDVQVKDMKRQLVGGSFQDNTPASSGHLTGVRARFLEAVRTNELAVRAYRNAVSDLNAQTDAAQSNRAAPSDRQHEVLGKHLELLRLQNVNTGLVGLKDELDSVKDSQGLSNLEMKSVNDHVSSNAPDLGASIDVDSLNRSLRSLEIAVIQARQRAKHQHGLLEQAKKAGDKPATPEQRLQGLSAARAELTTWLEESLEKCQEDSEPRCNGKGEFTGQSLEEMQRELDEQYNGYVAARRRLLLAVAKIKEPLSSGEAEDETPSSNVQPVASPEDYPGTELFKINEIEKRLIPNCQHSDSVRSQRTFVTEQTQIQASALSDMLELLSDESQLLQAFPVLAHSGRFLRAAKTFGTKQDVEGGEGDDLSKQLHPWLFAAEAADTASLSTKEVQMTQSQQAMASISQSFVELKLLQLSTNSRT